MDNGFKYIIENNGIDTEDSYPYKAADGQCKFDSSNVYVKPSSQMIWHHPTGGLSELHDTFQWKHT